MSRQEDQSPGGALIDELLARFREPIGSDYPAYRGHVHRVFRFCEALSRPDFWNAELAAVAAVFHDLGIWTAGTMDYLPPSTELARQYLEESGHSEWNAEVTDIIDNHHKLRRCRGTDRERVEAFRRADLVDLTGGRVRFGLDKALVRSVFTEFPTHGFHRRVLILVSSWAVRHPLKPFPAVKW